RAASGRHHRFSDLHLAASALHMARGNPAGGAGVVVVGAAAGPRLRLFAVRREKIRRYGSRLPPPPAFPIRPASGTFLRRLSVILECRGDLSLLAAAARLARTHADRHACASDLRAVALPLPVAQRAIEPSDKSALFVLGRPSDADRRRRL